MLGERKNLVKKKVEMKYRKAKKRVRMGGGEEALFSGMYLRFLPHRRSPPRQKKHRSQEEQQPTPTLQGTIMKETFTRVLMTGHNHTGSNGNGGTNKSFIILANMMELPLLITWQANSNNGGRNTTEVIVEGEGEGVGVGVGPGINEERYTSVAEGNYKKKYIVSIQFSLEAYRLLRGIIGV